MAVVQALAAARVFVAVVAVPGAAADLALLTATLPGGRRALPAFTSPEALARFRADARPVPVAAPRAALSAVAEGCDLLDLDPAGPVAYLVRRPAVWALGQGRPWVPSYADPVVAQEVSRLGAEVGGRATCGRGAASELRVELALPPGLDAAGLAARVSAFEQAVSRSEVVAERVDALEVALTSVPVLRDAGGADRRPGWSLAIGSRALARWARCPSSDTAKSCAPPACWGCCSSGFIARGPVIAVSTVLTLHVVLTLHLDFARAGLLVTALTVSTAVGAPWRGRAVDRLGLRRALLPAIVLGGGVWLVAPFLPYPGLVVAAVVGGVFGLPAFAVIRQALAVAVGSEHRRTTLALDSMSVELSFMTGPAIAVVAATQWSTRGVLVSSARRRWWPVRRCGS